MDARAAVSAALREAWKSPGFALRTCTASAVAKARHRALSHRKTMPGSAFNTLPYDALVDGDGIGDTSDVVGTIVELCTTEEHVATLLIQVMGVVSPPTPPNNTLRRAARYQRRNRRVCMCDYLVYYGPSGTLQTIPVVHCHLADAETAREHYRATEAQSHLLTVRRAAAAAEAAATAAANAAAAAVAAARHAPSPSPDAPDVGADALLYAASSSAAGSSSVDGSTSSEGSSFGTESSDSRSSV